MMARIVNDSVIHSIFVVLVGRLFFLSLDDVTRHAKNAWQNKDRIYNVLLCPERNILFLAAFFLYKKILMPGSLFLNISRDITQVLLSSHVLCCTEV